MCVWVCVYEREYLCLGPVNRSLWFYVVNAVSAIKSTRTMYVLCTPTFLSLSMSVSFSLSLSLFNMCIYVFSILNRFHTNCFTVYVCVFCWVTSPKQFLRKNVNKTPTIATEVATATTILWNTHRHSIEEAKEEAGTTS